MEQKKANELQKGDCFQATELGMWRVVLDIEDDGEKVTISTKEGPYVLYKSNLNILHNVTTVADLLGATDKQLNQIISPIKLL